MGFWDNVKNLFNRPEARVDRREAAATALQKNNPGFENSTAASKQRATWDIASAMNAGEKAQRAKSFQPVSLPFVAKDPMAYSNPYAYNSQWKTEQQLKDQANPSSLKNIASQAGYWDDDANPMGNDISNISKQFESDERFRDIKTGEPVGLYADWNKALGKRELAQKRISGQDSLAQSYADRWNNMLTNRANRLETKANEAAADINEMYGLTAEQLPSLLFAEQSAGDDSSTQPGASGGEGQPTSGETADDTGTKSPGNVSATEVTEEENPYAPYMENGYFDENAYLAHLLEEAENEYWQKTFPELMTKYGVDDITTANLADLINKMTWDEFHDYATDEYIYDPLYSHAFIMDEYGNREYVDLTDPNDWGRYEDFYGGMNLQNEAESGNWANVGAITGTGTNVAGQQIANITGYNPMTGEMTDSMNIPVSTKDFEQVYEAFPAVYAANGFPEGDYNAGELSQEQKAIIAGTLADVIGRDAYIRYLTGKPGAYGSSQYALDDDGIVDDFYMISGPDEINPYFSNLSYYSSRG